MNWGLTASIAAKLQFVTGITRCCFSQRNPNFLVARRGDRSYSNLTKEIENEHPSMRRMLAKADTEGKSHYVVYGRGGLGRDPFLTGLAASGYRGSSGQLSDIRRASSHAPRRTCAPRAAAARPPHLLSQPRATAHSALLGRSESYLLLASLLLTLPVDAEA